MSTPHANLPYSSVVSAGCESRLVWKASTVPRLALPSPWPERSRFVLSGRQGQAHGLRGISAPVPLSLLNKGAVTSWVFHR